MKLISLHQIIQALHDPIDKYPDCVVTGFSVDTRTLKPHEIYVALKGERVDGHEFLFQACKKGASAAIVSKAYEGPCIGLPLIRVDDPLFTLQELARIVLAHRQSRVVAVTGSVGKTTTKDFIALLLQNRYDVFSSPGNSNSQIGLPLAILNHTTGEEDLLVLEMGMTQPNHLTRLIQIAPPEVALITSVALVHACHFDSLEAIARTKAEILCHPQTRLGVLSWDIPFYSELAQIGKCRKLSFSTVYPQADYYLDMQNDHQIHSPLERSTHAITTMKLPGRHNRHNLLASIVVARYFSIPWKEIEQSISRLTLPEKRLQFVRIPHKEMLFINDAYNASEPSVKSALEILPAPQGRGRKIAVLGSMMELGKFSDECHRRVGEFALHYVDRMYCLGKECQPIYEIWKQAGKPVELFLERSELMEALRSTLKAEDVILLKGSRSKELWKVLEEL